MKIAVRSLIHAVVDDPIICVDYPEYYPVVDDFIACRDYPLPFDWPVPAFADEIIYPVDEDSMSVFSLNTEVVFDDMPAQATVGDLPIVLNSDASSLVAVANDMHLMTSANFILV